MTSLMHKPPEELDPLDLDPSMLIALALLGLAFALPCGGVILEAAAWW